MNAPARRPVWASLPVEEGERAPRLNDGDSYVVELSTGEQLWAVYSLPGGFVPCDDEGNEVATGGYDSPVALDNVARVCVSGYGPGFGPSCPVAGQAPRIRLVVASPSLVAIINESQRRARELLGERFGAAS